MGRCFGSLFENTCCNRFRAKLHINEDHPLQNFPKPKEAGK